jgi:hypothetical protein
MFKVLVFVQDFVPFPLLTHAQELQFDQVAMQLRQSFCSGIDGQFLPAFVTFVVRVALPLGTPTQDQGNHEYWHGSGDGTTG